MAISLRQLLSLAVHLRKNGFSVDIYSLLQTEWLLRRVSAPESASKFSDLLRPVFCKDEGQQLRFGAVLQGWLVDQGLPPPPLPPSPPSPPHAPPPQRLGPIVPLIVRLLPALVVTSLLLGALAVSLAWWRTQPQPFDVRVTSFRGAQRASPQQTVDVRVFGRRCARMVGVQGLQHCSAAPDEFPVVLTATATEGKINIKLFTSQAGWHSWFVFGRLAPVEITLDSPPPAAQLAFSATVAGFRLEPHDGLHPKSAAAKDPEQPPARNVGGAILVGLIVFVINIACLRYLLHRGAGLVRAVGKLPAQARVLAGRTKLPRLLLQKAMQTLAVALRQTLPLPVGRLDANRTAEASARQAGVFSPVYSGRRDRRFLTFVRRQCMQDHQGLLAELMVGELCAVGLDMQAFCFDGAGTALQPYTPQVREGQPKVSYQGRIFPDIAQVLAANPGAECFLLCEPDSLLAPLYGGPLPWMRTILAHGTRCVVLALGHDCAGERALDAAGVEVVALTSEALAHLTRREGGGLDSDIRRWRLPRRVAGPPFSLRWEYQLHRMRPAAGEIVQICDEIKKYMGEVGYRWVQACAVWPEIQWPMTQSVGCHLVRDAVERELLLLKLCNLVWFQKAYMPDWLQVELQRGLSRNDVKNLQGFFWQQFEDNILGDKLTLEYAVDGGPGQIRAKLGFWLRLPRWLRGVLGLVAYAAEGTGKEQNFVRFLLWRNVWSSALPIPLRILAGMVQMGLAPSVLAVVFSLGIALAASALVPMAVPPARNIPPSVESVFSLRAADASFEWVPGTTFRDVLAGGGKGPAMVMLPIGSYWQGAAVGEVGAEPDEKPQRLVKITYKLAVGKYPVTFDEWERCVIGGGCTTRLEPNDFGWGRGLRPVIDVSYRDALEYVHWLNSQLVGGEGRYRLPSEMEWEYAARGEMAGEKASKPFARLKLGDGSFSDGDCIHTDQANFDGNYDYNKCGAKSGDYRKRTVEVGSLMGENQFGLHDMQGNVYQWVADCYVSSYANLAVPSETRYEDGGMAAKCDKDGRRVLRGGSWNFYPVSMRSAIRDGFAPTYRNSNVGFRVARTLPDG